MATIDDASFQTLMASAVDAIGTGDFATAWTKYAQARFTSLGMYSRLSNEAASLVRSELKDLREDLVQAERAAARLTDGDRLGVMRTRRSR